VRLFSSAKDIGIADWK